MVVVGVRAFYSDYLSLNSAEFCRFILWNFLKKRKLNPKMPARLFLKIDYKVHLILTLPHP